MLYPAIHWLNDDILLDIFNCYRLDNERFWNDRLLWRKLSQVCQRWRHLIYECALHLGVHIECTNGSPIMDRLDLLPPLPLFVRYHDRTILGTTARLTEQKELGIYHALRLHGRLCHIDLVLPPSILHKVVVLMDEYFPILEHLSLRFTVTNESYLPITLPKAFLATNLRHLTLPSISPPRRLQLLTSTASLVTLELSHIQTSSYFRPRLLAARLRCLLQLDKLSIRFSTPLPLPGTEDELLGEQGALVTLPSLKYLQFDGVGAYLESLLAQIMAPLLNRLYVTLLNQITFPLPHLYHLINATEALKLPNAVVKFDPNAVEVFTVRYRSCCGQLRFRVICKPLDWQIDCTAQISHALIPALSRVETLMLYYESQEITTELRNDAINGATWHLAWRNLLRSYVGLKTLRISDDILEELSRTLQADEVESDPGFLPNLRFISARHNRFTAFINTRRVVGRPVQFKRW